MVEKFCDHMIEMLKIEYEAECENLRKPMKEMLRNKNALQDMKLVGRSATVWSGVNIEFELKGHESVIKKNDFVKLVHSEDEKHSIGMVSSISKHKASIAVQSFTRAMALPSYPLYTICLDSNDTVHERLMEAMQMLRSSVHQEIPKVLIEIFFEERNPSHSYLKREPCSFFNEHLNEQQKEAVEFALSQPEVALIHGPPGTGKTITLVEIILQLIKMDLKVLVCAPSNIAVDNLVKKLADSFDTISNFLSAELNSNNWMVRYGHPFKVHPDCQHYSLESLVKRHPNYRAILENVQKINNLLHGRKTERSFSRIKKYSDELNYLKKSAISDTFKNCHLVLSTLTSVSVENNYFGGSVFDIVVVDECSQGLEAASWLALMHVNKCILVGDHKQLYPTVKSTNT